MSRSHPIWKKFTLAPLSSPSPVEGEFSGSQRRCAAPRGSCSCCLLKRQAKTKKLTLQRLPFIQPITKRGNKHLYPETPPAWGGFPEGWTPARSTGSARRPQTRPVSGRIPCPCQFDKGLIYLNSKQQFIFKKTNGSKKIHNQFHLCRKHAIFF